MLNEELFDGAHLQQQVAPRPRTVGGKLISFCGDRRGAAGVEHALFLALIVGVVLLALEGLALMADHTFSDAAHGIAGDSTHVAASPNRPQAAPNHAATAPQAVSFSPSSLVRLWLLPVICTICAVGWLVMSRRRKRAAAADEDETEDDEAAVEIDHDAIFEKRHKILRILSGDVGMLFDSRMLVKHLLSPRLSTIEPSATAEQVRERMQDEKIRHLMVCDKKGGLVGVISDRDLNKTQARTAKEMMTPDPITVEPDSLVSPAVTLLIKRRISCLPVVDGERLVGVLTTTDLMMALQCVLHALQKVADEIADVHKQAKARSGSNEEQREPTLSA